MDFPFPVPVKEIASWINASIIGNEYLYLKGINEIHKVQEWDITFVDHPKYFNASLESKASAIIVPSEMDCPPGKALLVADNPFLAYEIIVNRYRPFVALTTQDRENYEVDPTAIIEPGAIIGQNVRIGRECHIHAGAIIRPFSYLGDKVVIHSGAVIGAPAFYFKKWPESYQAWTGCGRVIIEDDVWIGSGTTIAQGVSGDTIIGAGTKIDCQVMIGHGVVIGKNCLIAAQVGIAGKTVLGDWCVVYGQVGIKQNIHLGDRTVVFAQSGVSKDLEGGHSYFGSPAEETRTKYKEIATLKNMAADYNLRKQDDAGE
ncbi:MAG TPA: LpxD N-terminal domain-containing protein [Saprospiraceae bacterium]|nr:LpxD N-terminal domain-containing protein [Saprospiraceae bacterium]